MDSQSFVTGVAALTAIGVAAYLLLRLAHFVFARLGEHGARVHEPEFPPGHGLDAAPLQPRLRAVRNDFVTELRQRRAETGYQDELLQFARETIRRLPFFRRPAKPVAEAAPPLEDAP